MVPRSLSQKPTLTRAPGDATRDFGCEDWESSEKCARVG
jgi:hypothetical protein